MTDKRLIEVDFPLEQVSLDSVHEKNVRHGHISTLHIWPARRPLAACRAALIATLLPDPGNAEERKAIYRRMAGTVVETIKPEKKNGKTVEKRKRETQGGILHWKRENGPDLDWFRDKIREAYGGRAPKVLDPFAGGGAIPLEAMRLGCEVTANDLNPVAWFILKCTLEYPQKLAGQTRPLPDFALQDRDFMASFLKAKGYKGAALRRELAKLNLDEDGPDKDGRVAEPELLYHRPVLDADLAWQVRAWGRWVLAQARKRLARRYPTYAEFQALKPDGNDSPRERVLQRETHPGPSGHPSEEGSRLSPLGRGAASAAGWVPPLQLLEPDADGKTDVGPLNAGYTRAYLADPRNPRWIAKPTVAYLWARTVRCKGCRATLPLLKTKWLAKKDNKRVLLTVTPVPSSPPDKGGQGGSGAARSQTKPPQSPLSGGSIRFGIETDVPQVGGNAAQRREHDKRHGAGTMSRSGAQCPCCPTIMSMDDIRYEGRAGRLGAVMTAVVVDGVKSKEYRLPTAEELRAAEVPKEELDELYEQIPFGLPEEPISAERPSPNSRGASGLPRYGFDSWQKIFTERQLMALGSFVNIVRSLAVQYGTSRDIAGYRGKSKNAEIWQEAVIAYGAMCLDRLADYSSAICSWNNGREVIRNTFGRFALPMVWDYTEVNPLSDTSGNFLGALEWVARFISHTLENTNGSPAPAVCATSATQITGEYDTIITDPPYYDAIPYSDLMDFFHVWLRRSTQGLCVDIDTAFREPLGPKWDHDKNDGELIDQPSRFNSDVIASRTAYEDGMFRTFRLCLGALRDDGRLVVAFANKQPEAWETLVSALIRAGFVVDGSWPIQTEMQTKVAGGARLSSSIWLVCKKRQPARPGWDTTVLAEMRERIRTQLRDFWDAGIRGPDFVWAATGPALEAFSKYPVVKKADEAGAQMNVSEFLREVRRIVVDFVVGRVLTQDGEAEAVSGLDDVTTYYLLHRKDFGLDKAPIGACILYALSCNLSDSELTDRLDILSRAGKTLFDDLEEDDRTDEVEESEADSGGTGNTIKLKAWHQRRAKWLGFESPRDRPVPLIDQAHRLMHLWRAGDEVKVNDYLDTRGLKRNALFVQLLQALIELAPAGSEERAILESLSNHIAAHGGIVPARQADLQLGEVS